MATLVAVKKFKRKPPLYYLHCPCCGRDMLSKFFAEDRLLNYGRGGIPFRGYCRQCDSMKRGQRERRQRDRERGKPKVIGRKQAPCKKSRQEKAKAQLDDILGAP